MPKIIRTARGELVDFDAIRIKQQLAQAPMNIEVARRKEFIDSKEGKRALQDAQPTSAPVIEQASLTLEDEFEQIPTPPKKSRKLEPVEAIPVIPER